MEYINIAFTGHRPNRLYGYDLNNPRYKQLSKILKELLDKIDYDNPGKGLKGIVGGALGYGIGSYNRPNYQFYSMYYPPIYYIPYPMYPYYRR